MARTVGERIHANTRSDVEEEDPSATRPPPMAHGTGASVEVRVAASVALCRGIEVW